MNELVPEELVGGDLADFDIVTANKTAYLQRLQLFGSKSDACAEQKIGIGHWGLVNDDAITDLGVAVDVVLLGFRAKALDTSSDTVVNNHDAQSEVFASIRERSGERDSGCMYGPEFLVYVPSEEVFATYFASSKTSRREAKKARSLMGSAMTLKCRLIETTKYKWHGPVVLPCSAALDLPDPKIIKDQIEKFNNPPTSDIEVVDDDNTRDR